MSVSSISEGRKFEGHSAWPDEGLTLGADNHITHAGLAMLVTVFGENDAHRSMALAPRLGEFKEDGGSRAWCLDINVTNSDIKVSTT